MSTTKPVSAANGNGQAAPSVPAQGAQYQFASAPIYDPAQHQMAFHKASGDLAQVFSQVPWMKFSIVAKPDYSELAQNATLQNFVAQVTAMTIARVSQQIHAEITERVDRVIKTITSDVNGRMKGMHVKIMQGVVSHATQYTSTEYHKLDFDPYNVLFKEMVSDSKEECHCAPHLYDRPAPPQPPVVKPTPTTTAPPPVPIPVITTPTPLPAPPVVTPPVVEQPVSVRHKAVDAPLIKNGSWIWSPEIKNNPHPAAGHTRVFRRTIKSDKPLNALSIAIAADDCYTVYVNGKLVGSGRAWSDPERYTVRFEPSTTVVVAVVASQVSDKSLIGLLAAGRVWNSTDANPTPIDFATNAEWVCYAKDGFTKEFIQHDFIASAGWLSAHVIAAQGSEGDWWKSGFKAVTPGRAPGKRITGIVNVPDAPDAPIAEQWLL